MLLELSDLLLLKKKKKKIEKRETEKRVKDTDLENKLEIPSRERQGDRGVWD